MATFDPRDINPCGEISLNEFTTIGIDPEYERRQNSLSMHAGGVEMLRVAQDGFYVRGKKVPADDKEAERVYNAFKQFLVWSELNRR